MRIWSLHPEYLDAKGLVALWRETLLAKHVLEGRTKGYKNHPQLNRFKASSSPLDAVNYYLAGVYDEAQARGFNFSREKIDWNFKPVRLTVTSGQMKYESRHLLNKLQTRDPEKYKEHKLKKVFRPHSLFDVVEGGVEDWEIV